MSGKGNDSSSYSESEKEFGSLPHMFHLQRSQVEVEDLMKDLEFKQRNNSSEIYSIWNHRLLCQYQNMSNYDDET